MTAAIGTGQRGGAHLGGRVALIVLKACRSSVGLARSFACQMAAGLPESLAGDVELCTSELVTNAVRYGSERADVIRVLARRRPRGLYVAVIDSGGDTVPHLVQVDVQAEGCRGLALVEAYATTWGAVPGEGGGFRVWFEIIAADGSTDA